MFRQLHCSEPEDLRLLTETATLALTSGKAVPEQQKNLQHILYVIDRFRFSSGIFYYSEWGVLWAEPLLHGVVAHALMTSGNLSQKLTFAKWCIGDLRELGAWRLIASLPDANKPAIIFARLCGFRMVAKANGMKDFDLWLHETD